MRLTHRHLRTDTSRATCLLWGIQLFLQQQQQQQAQMQQQQQQGGPPGPGQPGPPGPGQGQPPGQLSQQQVMFLRAQQQQVQQQQQLLQRALLEIEQRLQMIYQVWIPPSATSLVSCSRNPPRTPPLAPLLCCPRTDESWGRRICGWGIRSRASVSSVCSVHPVPQNWACSSWLESRADMYVSSP